MLVLNGIKRKEKMHKNIQVDEYQEKAIKTLDNTLLIAGAGAGKTFTISQKINYLISSSYYKEKDILVISFTNKSIEDLKKKINYKVDIYTFHKLAMQILNDYHLNYQITSKDTLYYITNEFFQSLNNESLIKEILLYYKEYDYFSFLKTYKYQDLLKIITTYIHLYKTNLGTISNIKNIASLNSFYTKLIIIIMNLYHNYLNENNELDFDDLIIKATNTLNKFYKYKLIIIDEFQDTSFLRWQLIGKLLKLNQAKIFAVGDDFQSIYHFSGCNINLFLDFKQIVPDAKILKLKYTYRNSQELINIAGKFILQNKKQIKKILISHKSIPKPIIFKYYFQKRKVFIKVINNLLNKYQDILILGRNNNDIYEYINNDFKKEEDYLIYKGKKLRYLTVHSAKGLEADVVVLINLENKRLGFPNQIKDNIILQEINDLKDNYLYAEERRLFYCALTRTKNEVILLTPYRHKSIFVKEIKKYC